MLVRGVLLAVYILLVAAGAWLIMLRTPAAAVNPNAPKGPYGRLKAMSDSILTELAPRVPRYITAKQLYAGHRVRAGDLVFASLLPPGVAQQRPPADDLIGKYLKRDMPGAAEISMADLSDTPDAGLLSKAGHTLRIWLGETNQALAKVLDVGWTIDLCDDTGCVAKAGRVVAVDCRSSTDASCTLVLSVNAEERKAYLDAKRKDKLAVIISEPR